MDEKGSKMLYDNIQPGDEQSLLAPEKIIDYGSIKRSNLARNPKKLFSGLFRCATRADYVYLTIGTFFALAHGVFVPGLGYVFGRMTDVFIKNSVNPLDEVLDEKYTDINLNRTFKSYALKSIVGLFSKNENNYFMNYVIFFSGIYVCMGVISFFCAFIQVYCWERVADKQLYRLRKKFFSQVLRQNIGWFEIEKRGDYAASLADDLERIRDGIGYKLSMLFHYGSVLISGFALSFVLNWRLTCAILALGPLLIFTSGYMAKTLSSGAAREQMKYAEAGSIAEEVFVSLKTVISFGTVDYEAQRYNKALHDGRLIAMKKYYVLAVITFFLYLTIYSSYGFGFWYGSLLVIDKTATVGEVFGVLICLLSAAFSFGNILPYFNSVGQAKGSGEVVQEIIDRIPPIDPASNLGLKPQKFTGQVIFKNVSFRYPTRDFIQVLNGINFEVNPGKIAAIVGESGSGKSTIVNLLLRFYDVLDGEITFDGINIKDLNLKWLRSKIGIVSQEPVLFGVSIADNIRYGKEDITFDEIESAAKLANAHSFIKKLPQGYDTLVGERGAQLSGGQKQRIAIARALVRDPIFLLLDEATSALDTESENIVHQALMQAMEGRTTLIIAHRLSTIKNAGTIYVMNGGEIVENGSHEELMELKGEYFKFVSIQTSDETELPTVEDLNPEERKFSQQMLVFEDETLEFGEKKEMSMMKCIFRLGRLNTPEWYWLLLGFVACIFFGSIPPAFAFLYSQMIEVYNLKDYEIKAEMPFWTWMFVSLGIVCGLAFSAKIVSMVTAAECLVARIRYECFRNVLRQELSWFDRESNSFSVLLTQLSRDAPFIKAAAGLRAGQMLTAFVTMTCGIGISIFFGWKMAVLLLFVSPLLIYSGYKQISLVRRSQIQDMEALDLAGRVAGECFRNIKTIQSLAQEELFVKNYTSHLEKPYKQCVKFALWFSFAYAFSHCIIYIMYALSFYYGGYLITIDSMKTTDVFRVFFAISFCTNAIGQGIAILQDFTKGKMAAVSIFKLLDRKSRVDPLSNRGVRKAIQGHIEFKNVTFIYPSRPHVVVLNNFNLTVQVGQTLALVGSSGCGKSTVINILEQFYLPTSGEILVDDININEINTDCLRSQIGLVTQEPLLFGCTIWENIAYGTKACGFEPSDCDVITVAKLANIHEFITTLPLGYDTICGDMGAQLSGGQKQRIAIARALIRNPKILLLDEATSALDSNSEKIVQEALDQARIGRTTIIIAHRLSTIKNADVIAVLHRGQVVEIGNHQDLLQMQGLYFNLVKNQV